MYIQKIENATSGELKVLFDKHISTNATVLTDKLRGYSPLAEIYNITQEKSEPDKQEFQSHAPVVFSNLRAG